MHGEVAALAEPLCSVRTHHEHYSSDAVADHAGWMRLYDKMQHSPRFRRCAPIAGKCAKRRRSGWRGTGRRRRLSRSDKDPGQSTSGFWPYPRWCGRHEGDSSNADAAVKARKRADPQPDEPLREVEFQGPRKSYRYRHDASVRKATFPNTRIEHRSPSNRHPRTVVKSRIRVRSFGVNHGTSVWHQ